MKTDLIQWSFWSAPHRDFYQINWGGQRQFLLSWALSHELAKKQFKTTKLTTDTYGANLLVERLGLDFNFVDVDLDLYSDLNSRWWILGKLHTYMQSDQPYIHIDYDVFLWKPLSNHLYEFDFFVQNIDPIQFALNKAFPPYYYVLTAREEGIEFFPEWEYYCGFERQYMFDLGIFGVRNVQIIAEYAKKVFDFIQFVSKRSTIINEKIEDNVILFEQYYLMAYASYYGITNFGSLFASHQQTFNRNTQAEVGYTHIYTGAKKQSVIQARLEHRVKISYPHLYKRIEDIGKESGN